MDQRTAWSGAGGVIAATSGTNAVAWAVGATAPNSPLPLWPAIMLFAVAAAGVYLLIAALARLWPLGSLGVTPAEVLDRHIRTGRQARRDALELDEPDAQQILDRWQRRVLSDLDQHYPLPAESFQLERGDDQNLSGQALVISTIAYKLRVLEIQRERLAG
jgi:hypothetical protein